MLEHKPASAAPRRASAAPQRTRPTPRAEYGEKTKVRLLVRKNPKRPGSASASYFSKYRTGMTLSALQRHYPNRDLMVRHLRYDVAHAFIVLE